MYYFNLVGIDYKILKLEYDENTSFEKIYQLLESKYCLSRDKFIISYKRKITPKLNIYNTIIPNCTLKMYSLFDTIKCDKIYFKKKNDKYILCEREMLILSDYFKDYYTSIDILSDDYTQLNIPIEKILPNKLIRKFGGKKKLEKLFLIYKKVYEFNPIKNKKLIHKPIYKLENSISSKLLEFLKKIEIDDLKKLINLFDCLEIDYYKEIILGYMAQYIYKKKLIGELITLDLI